MQLIYGGKVLKVETVQLSVIVGPVSIWLAWANPLRMQLPLQRAAASSSVPAVHMTRQTGMRIHAQQARCRVKQIACCAGCAGTHFDAHGGEVPRTRRSTAVRHQPCAAARRSLCHTATQPRVAWQPVPTAASGGGSSRAPGQCPTTVGSAAGSQRQHERRGRQWRVRSRQRGISAARSERLDAVPECSGHLGRPALGHATGRFPPPADGMHSVVQCIACLML